MNTATRFLAPTALAIFIAASAHAAVLVQYDFASSLTPSSTDPGVSTSQSVVGFTAGFGGGRLNVPAADTGSTPSSSTDYFTFTVTPSGFGTVLDLSSLTFDIGRQFTGGGYTAQWALYTSLDAFTSSIANGTLDSGASGTLFAQSVDLTGPAYDSLSTITFRLAFADSNNGSGNAILVDNVTLNGAVVPEPHEYAAMAGVGLLGFAVWRRSRRA